MERGRSDQNDRHFEHCCYGASRVVKSSQGLKKHFGNREELECLHIAYAVFVLVKRASFFDKAAAGKLGPGAKGLVSSITLVRAMSAVQPPYSGSRTCEAKISVRMWNVQMRQQINRKNGPRTHCPCHRRRAARESKVCSKRRSEEKKQMEMEKGLTLPALSSSHPAARERLRAVFEHSHSSTVKAAASPPVR